MLIKRTSPLTGKVNFMEIDITDEQLNNWFVKKMSIQDAMPHLTSNEREFLMTGYTQEDWDVIFAKEKE